MNGTGDATSFRSRICINNTMHETIKGNKYSISLVIIITPIVQCKRFRGWRRYLFYYLC